MWLPRWPGYRGIAATAGSLYYIVLYCFVLYCIALYCIQLGSTFRNQVNLVGDQLSVISRSFWRPRRCDMVAATLRYGVRGGCAAALSRYRGHRRNENAGYNKLL